MIRISQLKLPITHTKAQLEKKIAKTLKNPGNSFTYEIKKQSLDCRHKRSEMNRNSPKKLTITTLC